MDTLGDIKFSSIVKEEIDLHLKEYESLQEKHLVLIEEDPAFDASNDL